MSTIGLPATSPEFTWKQRLDGRSRRVIILLAAVFLMSLGDLSMTLTHLTSYGMLESNPLARSVMAFKSPGLLAFWKLGTLTLGLFILYKARRTALGELGSWFCFAVLTWLTIHWVQYNNEIATIGPELMKYAAAQEAWVEMCSPDF